MKYYHFTIFRGWKRVPCYPHKSDRWLDDVFIASSVSAAKKKFEERSGHKIGRKVGQVERGDSKMYLTVRDENNKVFGPYLVSEVAS